MSREVMEQALDALVPLANAHFPDERGALTDEDVNAASESVNSLRAALTEPEPELGPVAWINKYTNDLIRHHPFSYGHDSMEWVPLYTTPPQRKPLTDEEIEALEFKVTRERTGLGGMARAIERAHGIGGEE